MSSALRTAALVVLVGALIAGCGDGDGGEAGGGELHSCANVAFTPQSDDLAAEIRARGVTCEAARRFVRDSEGRPGESFRGLTCTRRVVESGVALPYTQFRCTGENRVIEWQRF